MRRRRLLNVSVLASMTFACVFVLTAQSPAQQTAPPAAAQATPPSSVTGFHEDLIVDVPSGTDIKGWISAGDHVAWEEKKGGDWTVKLDGKQQGATYQGVEFLKFSEDGSHLHFFGKRDGKWIHVFDGKETSLGYLFHTTVALQPDGDSFAYSGCQEKKKCHLVVNDKEMPEVYEDISYPRYSPDGKRIAFFARPSKKWMAIVDGKETGPELEAVEFNEWGFSKETQRFYAAVLLEHSRWTYIVDDAPGPAFDVISPIEFSQDGKHYAYGGADAHGGFAKSKTGGTVVLDGQSGTMHEGAGMSGKWTILATGYSSQLAFGVHDLNANFHGVSNPSFNFAGNIFYAWRQGKGDITVTDGKNDSPPFDELLSGIVFTKDPEHSAYVAQIGKDFVEMRDNQTSKTFPVDAKVGAVDWILFTKDGAHLAFQLIRGGLKYRGGNLPFVSAGTFEALRDNTGGNIPWLHARRTVVINDQSGKEYNSDAITMVQFSEDQRHFCYAIYGTDQKRDLVVVDGNESGAYEALNGLKIAPDGKGVSFIARDASRLLRVSYPLQ